MPSPRDTPADRNPVPPWLICLDRGGTFTDGIAFAPDGSHRVVKVLSGPDSPAQAIAQALRLREGESPPGCELRLGSTLATNALLERRGARHALLITEGFGDALSIGTQQRPELFTLAIDKPSPLAKVVIEVKERLDARGQVIRPLDRDDLRGQLSLLKAQGYQSLAIVFLHACLNPSHERQAGEMAEALGFACVALSHLCDPAPGLIGRGETTCADAYLTPLLQGHLRDLQNRFPSSRLLCMHSAGGLVPANRFRGPQAILSGPAGGWLACRTLGKRLGISKWLGFDMGGTSTDIGRWQKGRPVEREQAGMLAGVQIRQPALAIHTVAAGGGSLCRIVGGRLTVGPESAGSHPGPLCYGRYSPDIPARGQGLTITDINLFLGILDEANFPFPLDKPAVRKALAAQVSEAKSHGLAALTPESLALGYRQVVDQAMAQAIREVTLSRGEELEGHALIAFGGAGGQHACAVATALGLEHVVLPPMAGIFSALGISQAGENWEGALTVPGRLLKDIHWGEIVSAWDRLRSQAQGVFPNRPGDFSFRLDMRYLGMDHSLEVEGENPFDSGSPKEIQTGYRRTFEAMHTRHFGYRHEERDIEIVAVRLIVEIPGAKPWPRFGRVSGSDEPPATERAALNIDAAHSVIAGRGQLPCARRLRRDLAPGQTIPGPALVLDDTGTLFVDADWQGEVDDDGNIHLRPSLPLSPALAQGPAELALFHAAFQTIAGEMGRVLQRTAISTNIKERLDFSCAIFDGDGRLVVNAPHIPVHLGSMGESVRHIIAAYPEARPGEAFLTNHPAHGGSHLPDMTVVSPVFAHETEAKPAFYVANRAHHADVGGSEPGSMPAHSRALSDEGVALSALPLIQEGIFQEEAIRRAFLAPPHPARNLRDNLSDFQAQLAANLAGIEGLTRLCREQGFARTCAMMTRLRENAAAQVASMLCRLGDRKLDFSDSMDDGSLIRVAMEIKAGGLSVDFGGTSPASAGNLNAPAAVVRSCLLYVLRCLVHDPMPLNEGCLDPVSLRLPKDGLLNPPPDAAVAGGNVETSQRVVDVLLGAFGLAAASQGTMNNFTFGDDTFGYYETLGGGEGASPGHGGASAVHTHMTNTRLTDPEILEMRFPVRLLAFSLRQDSGGVGRFRGGMGMIRHYRFLKPVRVSLLTQRRAMAPYGQEGGGDGSRGRNLRMTPEGLETLPGSVSYAAAAGEELRIETPGGGGWGSPSYSK